MLLLSHVQVSERPVHVSGEPGSPKSIRDPCFKSLLHSVSMTLLLSTQWNLGPCRKKRMRVLDPLLGLRHGSGRYHNPIPMTTSKSHSHVPKQESVENLVQLSRHTSQEKEQPDFSGD